MDELFAPPSEAWVRPAPSYLKLKRLMVLITWTIFFAIPVTITALWLHDTSWWWIPVAIAVLGLIWIVYRFIRVARYVASLGYCERDTDLYVTGGVFFRDLTIVPYGRMQQVNVTSGPIERRFGLASVQLVTASSATDASIGGLSPESAAALRDRLSSRGESQASGL